MKKLLFTLMMLIVTSCIGCRHRPPDEPEQRVKGLIPDKETAVKIAEAIWLPIYGDKIYEQKPFEAYFAKDRWVVITTSHLNDRAGAHYFIVLYAKDARIMDVGWDLGGK